MSEGDSPLLLLLGGGADDDDGDGGGMASICRLVCWCIVRAYDPRSAGGDIAETE